MILPLNHIVPSVVGYTTSYNLLTSRPPTMRRWSISKMQSMWSRSWGQYRLLEVNLLWLMAQFLHTRFKRFSLNRRHLLTIKLTHLQSVNRQGLPSTRIFGMLTSPNPFTKHMNLDLILTLLLTLCKHICVTSWGWFPRKRSVSYHLSLWRPGPSYPMTFRWTFFGPYR